MRLARILFWLTPPVLALALYGSTLSLPFFWDDVPHFQYLHHRSISQIWLDASITPYYRPLTFSLWRLLQLAVSPTNTASYHALNVLVWIVDGWLVSLLAKQLSSSEEADLTGWLAGTLLIVFPFASQSIPWAASFSHPLVTMLTLGACVCVLQFDQNHRIGWAIAATLCAALAPFASEAGVVAAALMTICVGVKQWPPTHALNLITTRRRSFIAIGMAFLLNIAYLPLRAQIPEDRPESGLHWVGWESVYQTAIFFLEGLTFPFQFVARWLMSLGLADLWAVAVLGAISLTLAWLALRDRRWLIFGVGYCFTAALPAIVSLPFSYAIVSPRLMTITAPAAAILWAAAAVEAPRRIAREQVRTATAVAAVVAASLIPAWRILRDVRLHHLALDHVGDFVRQIESHPNEKHLIVNALNWIAPVNAAYGLGHEGVEVMPAYVTPQLLVWAHTRTLYDVDAVTFPLVFPQLKGIYFSTWGETLDWNAMAERVRAADRVSLVRYGDDRIEFQEVGRVLPAAGDAIVSFDDRIWLTGQEAKVNGSVAELQLDWRVNATSGEDIFANAFDCEGNMLGLSGGASMGGIYPIWLWQPGETIREIRRIPLNSLSPNGCYRIELGLFDPSNGARAEAFDENGERLENEVMVIELGR